MSHPDELILFFKQVAIEMKDDDVGKNGICPLLEPVLAFIQKEIQMGTILILPAVSLNTLEAFSKIPDFALVRIVELKKSKYPI